MYYGLLIIGLTYIAYKAIVSRLFQRRCEMYLSKIPKVPNSVPYLGVALDLAAGAPWATFAEWSKSKGNTFQFEVNGERIIYTSEPKFIKRVVQTKQRNYKKAVDFGFKHFMCLLGKGLVTTEGDVHMRARGQLINVFRTDLLDDIPRLSVNAVTRLFQTLSNAELGVGEGGSAAKNQDAEKTKKGTTAADLLEGYRLLTLEVISTASMSITPEESDKVFPGLYIPIAEECNKRSWKPWRQFYPTSAWSHYSKCKELDNFFSEYVVKRKQLREAEQAKAAKTGEKKLDKLNLGGRKEDILDRVMAYHEPKWNPSVSIPQLRDDVKTFILAGHETSGTTLTWATYELMRNPDILKLVRDEHEDVFGKDPITMETQLPTVEVLRTKLTWTLAVLREVLRLYSIVPLLPRVTAQDDYILKGEWGGDSDILIPKDTIIMVGVDGLHHREDIWPEPNTFNPKRFLDMSQVSEQLFMPFIYGPRNCIGQHLSLLETSVVLSYTMHHWDFTFANSKDAEEGLTRDPLIAPLAPLGGLQVFPKQRIQNKATYPTMLE